MSKPMPLFILILIFLTVLIGSIQVYYIFNHSAIVVVPASSTATTTTEAHNDSMKDWKIYSENGFSFKYPADFILITTSGTSSTDKVLKVPIHNYFHTIIEDDASLTISTAASRCPTSQGETLGATSTIQAVNTIVTKVPWSGVGAGQLYIGADYTTIKDGLCYSLHLSSHGANGAGFYFNSQEMIARTDATQAEDMKNFLSIVDKIAATFQFTQ